MGKRRFGGLLGCYRRNWRLQLSIGALQLLGLEARDATAYHLLLHFHLWLLLLLDLIIFNPNITVRGIGLLGKAHLRIEAGRGRSDRARLEDVLVQGSSSRHHDFVALCVGRFMMVHAGACRSISPSVDSDTRV